jgi:hypothetical protein
VLGLHVLPLTRPLFGLHLHKYKQGEIRYSTNISMQNLIFKTEVAQFRVLFFLLERPKKRLYIEHNRQNSKLYTSQISRHPLPICLCLSISTIQPKYLPFDWGVVFPAELEDSQCLNYSPFDIFEYVRGGLGHLLWRYLRLSMQPCRYIVIYLYYNAYRHLNRPLLDAGVCTIESIELTH